MPEQVEIKSSSKETVALSLAFDIAKREALYNDTEAYRKNLLDLYVECLDATRGARQVN